MGFWNRNRYSWNSSDDMSISEMKRSMYEFGLTPSDSARDLFGWTEDDDLRTLESQIANLEYKLARIQSGQGSLREELDVQIKLRAYHSAKPQFGGIATEVHWEYDFSRFLDSD